MKTLIIDNYDSFTFNLYQYIGEVLANKVGAFKLDVLRNDEATLYEIKKGNYHKIIISPGPGSPADRAYFGICSEVITKLGKKIPLLGICLGMQGISLLFWR